MIAVGAASGDDMRLLIILAIALSGCGTRPATLTHAGLAGASLGLMVLNDANACDGDHSECDRVGPGIMHALLLTGAVTFGIAAVISYAAEERPPATPSR